MKSYCYVVRLCFEEFLFILRFLRIAPCRKIMWVFDLPALGASKSDALASFCPFVSPSEAALPSGATFVSKWSRPFVGFRDSSDIVKTDKGTRTLKNKESQPGGTSSRSFLPVGRFLQCRSYRKKRRSCENPSKQRRTT